jgi:hypothetical protein
MFDERIHYQGGEGRYRCEFEHTLKGEYCQERGQARLDGLLLCNRHARHLRLEERVAYCRAILAHIELWSRSARTRGREDIVGLLEIERTKASAALGRVGRVLEDVERGEGDSGSGDGKGRDGRGVNGRIIPLWPPLLLLFLGIAVLGHPL